MCTAMSRLWILAFFVVLGCDSQELQSEFEAQAFSTAEGFTRTTSSGETVSVDPDDWRTAPAYRTDIEVDPAFPNPAGIREVVTVPILVRGSNAVQGGLDLVFFDTDRLARRLDNIRSARSAGAYVLRFNASSIGQTGLVRVFILDPLGDLVSYGDIQIDE